MGRNAAAAWITATLLAVTACGDPGSPAPSDAGPVGSGTTGPAAAPPQDDVRRAPRSGPDGALADALADGVRRPRTAAQAARAVLAAEDAIRAPGTTPEVLEVAGELAQVSYRVIGVRPRWDEPVREALPRRLHRVVELNVSSRREFRSMHTVLSDTLPAWRVVEPAPMDDLVSFYLEAEERFGVDWEYLAAINLVETGMGRIRGLSVAGAQGPMQFIPATWEQYGSGDINDPRDAILSAARYLDARGFSEAGGIPGALYSYNNHPAYVRGVTDVAQVLQDDPRAFRGYYHWQIYYLSSAGDIVLRPGYEEQESIPVERFLQRDPDAAST